MTSKVKMLGLIMRSLSSASHHWVLITFSGVLTLCPPWGNLRLVVAYRRHLLEVDARVYNILSDASLA